MSSRFKQLLLELARANLDLFSYEGEAGDAAFDLTTADTFLAGIVDNLRGGKTVPSEFRHDILHPWLEGTVWCGPDGSRHDLSLMPERLLEHPRLLERVRSACVRELREPVD